MTSHAAEYAPLVALHGEARASEAARHALWRVGELSWLLHSGQREADVAFADARMRGIRRFVAEIGRRWGKSFWAIVKSFETALSGPRKRIPYAAATFTSLNQFIVPIARFVIDTAPPDMRPELVGGEVRFQNESVVVMQGCEDHAKADRLRGPAADMAVVDEAAFIAILEYVIKSVLLFQLATTDGMMLVLSSSPFSPAHPFISIANEAEARGSYIRKTIHDAPHLSKRVVETLCTESGGPKSTTWRREALCERVVDSERAIVPEFGDAEREVVLDDGTVVPSIVRALERPAYFDAYIVGDQGYVDLSVLLFAYWHFPMGVIVVEDEVVEERATSNVLQKRSAAKAAELWGSHPIHKRAIDAPAITRADMSRLQDEDDPTREAIWGGVRKAERVANVNRLRLDIGGRTMVIHPRCKVLIAHLRNGIWNERRSDFDRSEGLGHFDGVAAAMYLSGAVDRNRNPFPAQRFDVYANHVPAHLRKPVSGWNVLAGGKKR